MSAGGLDLLRRLVNGEKGFILVDQRREIVITEGEEI